MSDIPTEEQPSCGYPVIDSDGEEQPCGRPATGWRWYQGVEHGDLLTVACSWHENEGGRRLHAAEEAVRVRQEQLAESYRNAHRHACKRDDWREKAEQAAAAITRVREQLQDDAEHGLRADLTPTVMFGDESHVYRQLTDYLRRLDQSARERARSLLALLGSPNTEEQTNG